MKLEAIRVLSLIAPMTQLNTPYPSTAYLTGFLRSRGIDAAQEDLALGLALALLSPDGLCAVREHILSMPAQERAARAADFIERFEPYRAAIGPTIAFLQGHDATLAHRICTRRFLPEGPRFASLEVYVDAAGGDPMAWAFGSLGVQDRARHLATLYLNDIADLLRESVDERFEFVRYGESLAQSQASFDPLAQALAAPLNLVDRTLRDLTLASVERHRPTVVLVSVPFPGAVYAPTRSTRPKSPPAKTRCAGLGPPRLSPTKRACACRPFLLVATGLLHRLIPPAYFTGLLHRPIPSAPGRPCGP